MMKRFWVVITPLGVVLVACSTTDSPSPEPDDDEANGDVDVEITETVTPSPTETSASESAGNADPTAPAATPEPTFTPVAEEDDEPGSQEVAAAIVEPDTGDINSWTYHPEEVTAQVGDVTTWTNEGAAAHTVTSVEGSSFEFDSGSMGTDETYSLEVPGAGEYDYFCTFHPWMEGTIVVEE